MPLLETVPHQKHNEPPRTSALTLALISDMLNSQTYQHIAPELPWVLFYEGLKHHFLLSLLHANAYLAEWNNVFYLRILKYSELECLCWVFLLQVLQPMSSCWPFGISTQSKRVYLWIHSSCWWNYFFQMLILELKIEPQICMPKKTCNSFSRIFTIFHPSSDSNSVNPK